MIMGDERPEKKLTPQAAAMTSTLGGHDKKKKKADCKSTGLTGPNSSLTGSTGLTSSRTGVTGAPSESGSPSKSKTRPSFKEILAKFQKQGAIQKKEKQPGKAKDTKPSSKCQEQSGSFQRQGNYTSFDGPIAIWYCWYPYFYTLMNYNRMHMQSYYIQYPSIYPNHASLQRPVVASNNLVKRDIFAAKQMRRL